MSQGPPPNNLLDPSPVNQSEQSPPHHQSAHHSLPRTSLGWNQLLAMVNPGHSGPMQSRPTQGNNQFFGRPIRPGNQHMPRPPMAGGTINPNHPPNAPQALPYPGLNQPVLFVIGDQFNQQSPYLSAYPANPPASYPQSGNLPPGNVSQPRTAQQSNGYRQTPPYPSFPMQNSPAVYYQPQQPQSQQPQQQQQQPQQQKEQQPQQQPEQPQQVPVRAPPPTTQPRESSGASRRARSSALRIVDPNVNRDVLTGEEVPPSAVVTPTTATQPEIVATGVVSAQVEAADEVEATATAAARAPSTKDYVPVPTVVTASPNMASYKEIGNTGIKYSRENLLGKGAFGDVYRGIYNDEQVAVKKLLLNRYEKEEREVNLQKILNHKNVLKIRKVEEDDDFRYIVLELCAGTLGEVIDKTYKGPAYPSDPIVLYQIADGLDYIHSQKLIHRDIKPENILISMNGQQLKLSDFGLSKRISIRDTCSMSGTKGTLLWMAPELQGNNKKATPKCDVFPCGCVFFVFLTRENGGIHPFGDMKDPLRLQALQLNIRSGKPINIDKLKADHYAVPVIREMVKKNPRKRIDLPNVKKLLRPFFASATMESLTYEDDQWSPVNREGKKIYESNFILKLQNNPACQEKPKGLAVPEVVRDKTYLKRLLKRGDSVSDSVVQYTVPRPIPETAQPPTLSRQVSKGVLMGKSTVTDDEIERKSHSLLGEYFANEKIEDAVLDMKEWLHPFTVARFINKCLFYVLERNKKERRATGTLLKEMVKRKLFHSSDILNGFTELFEWAEDFIVDIPKLWEYVAELVVLLFEEGVINLNLLPQLSSILKWQPEGMAAHFVAAVLKELVKEQGVAGAEKMFIMSNVHLTSILPSNVDPNAFLAQHKELDFLSKIDSILKSETPSTSQVNIGFQYSLEKYLRDATHLTTDEVCSWIQKQYVGDVNPAFIRALGTAVIESSIEGRGTDSKLNNTVLKHWTEVLRRYVENIHDRELQLLYAVQTLVTQRQHPKGLIQGIFETLYDSNVVSEEGFESWVSVDDPLEREGKAMALSNIL